MIKKVAKEIISRVLRTNPKRFSFLSDKSYLQFKYFAAFGKTINFSNPKSFNEKLQWLKVNDRRSSYTKMVDKHKVKDYIANKIGSEYIIPTLGVWDNFDDINFDALPNQFVLKCTHDSGGIIICKDKKSFDMISAKKKIEKSLCCCFFWMGREWPYKNVKPKIIAEQYMGENLNDYKLFCFNGIPKMTLVCSDRFAVDGLKEDFFDENWVHISVKRPGHENSNSIIECPKQYELMKALAADLSYGIPFSRIDLFEIEGKVYFGEITFYPASGFDGFEPNEWDITFGEWIKLPNT